MKSAGKTRLVYLRRTNERFNRFIVPIEIAENMPVLLFFFLFSFSSAEKLSLNLHFFFFLLRGEGTAWSVKIKQNGVRAEAEEETVEEARVTPRTISR